MNMPEMNGLVTLVRSRAMHPRRPVLLATGYLDAAGAARIAKDPFACRIKKPFSLDEVRARLEELRRRKEP